MDRRTFVAMLAGSGAAPLLGVSATAAPVLAHVIAEGAPERRRFSALLMSDADGNRVSLDAYRGRGIVLNLWGPWCLPCRREMPSLSRLKKKLADRSFDVLPLAFDWLGVSAVRRFYAETAIGNLPVLMGDVQNLTQTTGHSRLPTTFVLDRQGFHVATVPGEAVWDAATTIEWLSAIS